MESILNIKFAAEMPDVLKPIPNGYGKFGLPFLYPYTSLPSAWYLVCANSGTEYLLDTSQLTYDSVKQAFYYDGSTDLVAYLLTQGYTIASGRYYYKLYLDGVVSHVIEGMTRFITDQTILTTSPYGEWIIYFNNSETTLPLTGFQSMIYFADGDSYSDNTFRIGVLSNGSLVYLYYNSTLLNTEYFTSLPSYIDITRSYYIKITRNSIIDEYVIGAIDTYAVSYRYSDESTYTLVVPTTGTNPVIATPLSTITNAWLRIPEGSKAVNFSRNNVIFEINDFTPIAGYALKYIEMDGGTSKNSQIFTIETLSEALPVIGGAYSSGYSTGYS